MPLEHAPMQTFSQQPARGALLFRMNNHCVL